MSKSYLLLMAICLLLGYGSGYAQQTAIANATGLTGMVVDQYGRPISGVEISIKKSDTKTISDEDGAFRLDAGLGATLVLSHPDYLVKEIKAPQQMKEGKVFKIDIDTKTLKTPATLDIPYRGTVDKDSYLGAATTIYSDEITYNLSSNILGAMAGRIAGLNVTQIRGYRDIRVAGGSNKDNYAGMVADVAKANYSDNTQFGLSLRGSTSPVVIVDGFESDLLNIDVENVESISLQKDALSSMFLGGRSSRGVMYITTKKPVGGGFKVAFTGKYGIQKAIKTPKALPAHQYAYLLNEALVNDGLGALYSPTDLQIYRQGSDDPNNAYKYPNVDWYDQVLKSSSAIQSYNLNATGGAKTAQYYVNLGYMAEDGLIKQSDAYNYNTSPKYERYMITSKINVNIFDNLKMTATVIGRVEDGREPGYIQKDDDKPQSGTTNILKELYRLPSVAYPALNPDGSYGGRNGYGKMNLLAQTLSSGYNKDNARDGLGNINIEHDMAWLTEGLSARMVGSVSSQSRSALIRSKKDPIFEWTPGGSYVRWSEIVTQKNDFSGVSNYQYMYGQVGLDYTKTISKLHTISGGLSADIKEVIDGYQLPERPGNILGEAKYDYAKKYFAQVAVNRSYLNRYAPGKQWGTFYALGLGWDISKESLMKDVAWVDKLKLRGVFGETGSSIGRDNYYTWRQQYDGDIFAVGDYSYSQGSSYTDWYNVPALGLIENGNALANPNLTWERAHKLNLGIDANLFNNRLVVAADYYSDNYFDLLLQRGKSIELIGLKYPLENIAKIRYQGLDLSVTYQDNVGNFNYYVSANWSLNQSEIKYMDEQAVPEDYMRRTGRPVGARYGLIAEGLYQTQAEIDGSSVIKGFTIVPGDIKYKDMNGDGVVDEFDMGVIANDKPVSYFGMNVGFEYKGFEVSAMFQGVYNRDINLADAGYEFLLGFVSDRNGYTQAYEHATSRWTPETAATATMPRLSTKANTIMGEAYNVNPNGWQSSYWVRSGNFVRLKNLSIAYTLPDCISRNYLGGTKVKLFVAGQNLWTQAACNLVDPEIINFSNYPMMKGFNAGVNLKF